MADFKPVGHDLFVYSATGRHAVFGWWSSSDWETAFEPVVQNPDGPGIGPWFLYYGSDPWSTARG